MAKFKVGEIALLKSVQYPEFNGLEIKIVKHFIWSDGIDHGKDSYQIKPDPASNGLGWDESALRKLPPKDDSISWEDMKDIWNPETVKIRN